MKLNALSAAIAATLISSSAMAVEFHGYMRAGVSQSVEGGTAICDGNGGSGHMVGRLGDECDMYAEMALSQNVLESDDVTFSIHTLVAYGTSEGNVNRQGNSWQGVDSASDNPWGGQRMSFREAYAKADFGKYTLWAGNRYYGRKDIHILDFYYINMSGYGAGVENIQVGSMGALSFALIQSAEQWQGDYTADAAGFKRTNKFDMRWAGIPMWKNASLEVDLIVGSPTVNDDTENANTSLTTDPGAQLTLEYTQGALLGGFNKFIIQSGTNGFARNTYTDNHGAMNYDSIEGSATRIIDWGVMGGKSWDVGYSVMYAAYDVTKSTGWPPTGKETFMNIVVRPSYKWTEIMSTVLEVGYAQTKPDGGDSTDKTKITLAQQWNAGRGFWARPSLRAYVSQYGGDITDTGSFKDNETMIGAQMEAWW